MLVTVMTPGSQCPVWVQVNATSGTDMEYIFSHSTFAGYTGYTDDPWGANQVNPYISGTVMAT